MFGPGYYQPVFSVKDILLQHSVLAGRQILLVQQFVKVLFIDDFSKVDCGEKLKPWLDKFHDLGSVFEHGLKKNHLSLRLQPFFGSFQHSFLIAHEHKTHSKKNVIVAGC